MRPAQEMCTFSVFTFEKKLIVDYNNLLSYEIIVIYAFSQGVKCILLGEPGKWVQSFFPSVFMLYRYCSP